MKKVLIPILLVCMCFFTGCTKNYKTVKEYSNAMQEVRTKLGDYTIEVSLSSRDKDIDCITYKKDDKWKTEMSKKGEKIFNEGMVYDGNEVYSYSKTEKIAMSMPFKQLIPPDIDKDGKALDLVMKMINPTGILFYWDIADNDEESLDSIFQFGKITKKNNYQCRILKDKTGDQLCISDKYGIAVYAKINTPKQGEVEYNVTNINNRQLLSSDVSLPAGIKKMSMADLFKNMAKMFESK